MRDNLLHMFRLASVITAVFALIFLGAMSASAEDIYYVGPTKGVNLLSAPIVGTKIAHLARNTRLEILERQHTWVKVKAAEKTGWIPEGAVRKQLQQSRSEQTQSSFFAAFSRWFGEDTSQQSTAVLGVRGLDQGGSTSGTTAATNMAAVKWMDGLALTDAEVDRFMREGKLKP